MNESWFDGTCKVCGFPVVITQPDPDKHPAQDYWWYCSNKACEHHTDGEATGDMETPKWVNDRPLPKTITADDVIFLLNEAFALDPTAIRALVDHRVPCNGALASHPTIQCGTVESWRKRRPKDHGLPDDAQGTVGLLGLLNGLLGKPQGGPIAAVYDLICDACGAENKPELDNKTIGDACPLCASGAIRLGAIVGFKNLWSNDDERKND